MTKENLTKEQLLKMLQHFEHYPTVTYADDRAYILAYLEDESCSISRNEIEKYIDENFRTIDELCPHCKKEVKLQSKFEAQVCLLCNTIILPCSICEAKDCLNCPLKNHSVEDVYNKHFNKMLEGTGYTACFVETSELYGEDDEEVDENNPYYMMPMYEAHIEDGGEEEVENTWTGRYCDASSVATELDFFVREIVKGETTNSRIIQELETLTGEKYESLDVESFESFLDSNRHLVKEISYTLGFIQSAIEIHEIEVDQKLETFVEMMHECFDKF
ncbi:MAG: hypothetical protein WC141_09420 [Arcobacteraceae bacterium]